MITIVKILLTLGCITSFFLYANKTSGKNDARMWHEPEGILFIILFIASGILIITS